MPKCINNVICININVYALFEIEMCESDGETWRN